VFNGTSTHKCQFVPIARAEKPAEMAKDGQRDRLYNTIRYTTTMQSAAINHVVVVPSSVQKGAEDGTVLSIVWRRTSLIFKVLIATIARQRPYSLLGRRLALH